MIKQKVAVVTGATRGVGHGIACQLAGEGYAIAALGTSEPERARENLQAIKDYGQPFLYFAGDLGSTVNRDQFVQRIIDEFGRIDVLVNNAGVAPQERRDVLEMSEESFDRVLGINLKGTFFLTQKVAGIMVEQLRENHYLRPIIINIGSISAYTSSPNRGEYCISKAGVSMITKLFADRLAAYGINVYEIRPGIIRTDMTRTVTEKYDRLIADGLTPIKRWGTPQDVADAVSVICSGKLAFSTGEVINVDGGFHLRRL